MIGRTLSHYAVTGTLGAGGMGQVYRATDTRLGRDVAIKLLPPDLADEPERLARLKREAKVLAALNHPNVAAIHGLEEVDGLTFLVMELVPGEDLAERLVRGPLPVAEAAPIARQIAEGIEEAHEKGVVHRDLKPANVRLTPDGRVKVLDFGIAKEVWPDGGDGRSRIGDSDTITSAQTEPGTVVGSVAYMAPEQARGQAVDKRADIWSFGVLWFEMLTGRRLFGRGTVTDTLAAVLRDDVDWTPLPRELPDAQRRVLARCLERDPKKRLRDIGEVRLALDDTVVGVPRTRAARPAPSRTSVYAAVTAASLLALLVAGWLLRPRGAGDGTGLKAVPITSSGTVIEAALSPDGKYLAYVESDQGLQSLWLKQIAGGQTLRLVPEQRIAYWGHTFSPDGNSILFAQKPSGPAPGELFSISTLGGTPRRIVSGIDSMVSFSPDGKRITYTRFNHPGLGQSSLMVAGADGSDPRTLATFTPPSFVAGPVVFFGGPAWSPDGQTIVTALIRRAAPGTEGLASLVRVNVADGAVTTLATPGWSFAAQAAWMPDGRSLLVVARGEGQSESQVWSVSFPDGGARTVTNDSLGRRVVSLSADGRSLVTVLFDRRSTMWAVPLSGGGKPLRLGRSTTDGANGIAFTPDGQVVYSALDGDRWRLWRTDASNGDRTPVFTDERGGTPVYPRVARDGTIYFLLRGLAMPQIWAVDADGSHLRTVVASARNDSFDLADGDSTIVYGSFAGSGAPALLRTVLATGRTTPLPLAGEPFVAFAPATDAAGKRIAFYRVDPDGRNPRLCVMPVDGGPFTTDVPVNDSPGSFTRIVLRDEGLYVNTMPGTRTNVWLQPLDGSPARPVTSFEDQQIVDFAVSPDGRTLVVARGLATRDAQLVTGFAPAR